MNFMSALVDTNILVYAYDKDAGYKNTKAAQLVGNVFKGEKNLYISNQNLAELFKILVVEKNIPVEEAKELVLGFFFSKNWLKITYKPETIIGAMQIYNHGFHFWDCLLAATAMENFVTTIYTENIKDFQKIPGIKAINPLL